MASLQFIRAAKDLHFAVETAFKNGISLNDGSAKVTDFKGQQKEAMRTAVLTGIATVDMKSHGLFSLVEADHSNQALVDSVLKVVGELGQTKDVAKLKTLSNKLLEFSSELPKDEEQVSLPKLPTEIASEITADYQELQKCMKINAHRSAVILCGRMLETALFRKYFELTNNDLLEKAPGTGLGNLVAKIAEKGEVLDPGLGNQIHLINQVRVHSVHKKQQPFNPSKQQAQAIVLYTLDVLSKLWSS